MSHNPAQEAVKELEGPIAFRRGEVENRYEKDMADIKRRTDKAMEQLTEAVKGGHSTGDVLLDQVAISCPYLLSGDPQYTAALVSVRQFVEQLQQWQGQAVLILAEEWFDWGPKFTVSPLERDSERLIGRPEGEWRATSWTIGIMQPEVDYSLSTASIILPLVKAVMCDGDGVTLVEPLRSLEVDLNTLRSPEDMAPDFTHTLYRHRMSALSEATTYIFGDAAVLLWFKANWLSAGPSYVDALMLLDYTGLPLTDAGATILQQRQRNIQQQLKQFRQERQAQAADPNNLEDLCAGLEADLRRIGGYLQNAAKQTV